MSWKLLSGNWGGGLLDLVNVLSAGITLYLKHLGSTDPGTPPQIYRLTALILPNEHLIFTELMCIVTKLEEEGGDPPLLGTFLHRPYTHKTSCSIFLNIQTFICELLVASIIAMVPTFTLF